MEDPPILTPALPLALPSNGRLELIARDTARNINRRYSIEASVDLFGAHLVETSWAGSGVGVSRSALPIRHKKKPSALSSLTFAGGTGPRGESGWLIASSANPEIVRGTTVEIADWNPRTIQ